MVDALQSDKLRQRDLNRLVILRMLLETSSVSRSAEALQISQSAVSKALERLRAEFHDPLLVRTSNRMFLTARAKALSPFLNAAFERIEEIYDTTVFDPVADDRVFTIGMNEYLQATLGQKLVVKLNEKAPLTRIHFRPISSNVPALLAEGTLDIAVGADTHESRGLRSRVVYQDEFICVGGRDRSGARSLSMADFLRQPQVDVSPSGLGTLPRIVEQQLFRNGELRNVIAMLSSYFALPELLNRLDAIALVPKRLFGDCELGARVREVGTEFPLPHFEIRLYWHNVTNGDPFGAWMRDLIVELANASVGAEPGSR